VAQKLKPRKAVKWLRYIVHMENKEPRKGFLGEWDRLTPKLKIIAVILMVVPIYFYPPSVILFLGYAVYANLRDK
jgi:hypothetical protein